MKFSALLMSHIDADGNLMLDKAFTSHLITWVTDAEKILEESQILRHSVKNLLEKPSITGPLSNTIKGES